MGVHSTMSRTADQGRMPPRVRIISEVEKRTNWWHLTAAIALVLILYSMMCIGGFPSRSRNFPYLIWEGPCPGCGNCTNQPSSSISLRRNLSEFSPQFVALCQEILDKQ